ncbi:MAG: hypothetical protein MSA66_05705 [Oscillospiraceae bacterium]|nr:hypothetical protein [Oscillospiraceae bacterium]
MKRKLISAVALILCAIMFLFCGCKSKKNGDNTTAPSDSGASVDVAIDESTEPSSEETTEPEKKESTPDAIKKVTDSTKKPGKVNTTTPSVKKPEWKKAGKYICGKNLAAGEYYVVPNSDNCSLVLTDGKHFDEKDIVNFPSLPCGFFVTMKDGYTMEVKNGKFILASEVDKMGATNGKYKLGSYRVGVDIPAGITTLGSSEGSFFTVFSSSDYFDEDAPAIIFDEDYPVYFNLEKGQRVLFMEDTSLGVKIPGANSDGSYNSGMYKVGKDIKPGKYTLVPTDAKNEYAVYYDLRYIEFSIKDYKKNVKAGTVITLTDGTYFRGNNLKLVPYVEPAPGGEGTGGEGTGGEGTGGEGTGSEGTGGAGTGGEGAGSEGTGGAGTGSEGAGNEGSGSAGTGSEGTGGEGAGSENKS